MLACRVLIGDITKGEKNCDPPLKEDGYTRFETMVNDMDNPIIYVATRDYCALPVYYIWFNWMEDPTNTNDKYSYSYKPSILKIAYSVPANVIKEEESKTSIELNCSENTKLHVDDKIDHRYVELV